MTSLSMRTSIGLLVTLLLGASFAANAASTRSLVRVSESTAGAVGNGESRGPLSLTGDGRLIAYSSDATNLVASDANRKEDVFVSGSDGSFTRIMSVGRLNNASNGDSSGASISDDGVRLVFSSTANNLTPGDGNGKRDIYLKESNGTVFLVSRTGNDAANDESFNPTISADGSIITFTSAATNLVPGDTNGKLDIYMAQVERVNGALSLISMRRVTESFDRKDGDDDSDESAPSALGRYVAFTSRATNLVGGLGNNGQTNVYRRDMVNGVTELVSIDLDGNLPNGASRLPAISDDGRFIAFVSTASDLVEGDTNAVSDVFVRDMVAGTTTRVSVANNRAEADGASGSNSTYLGGRPAINASGRYVAFTSVATNLTDEDTGDVAQAYVYDRQLSAIALVSSTPGDEVAGAEVSHVAISADGRFVGFVTEATNLIAGDPGSLEPQVYVVGVQLVGSTGGSPIADAGPDQSVLEGEFVILDGTGSSDPEGDELNFSWRQIVEEGDPVAELSDPASATPSFFAPGVRDSADLVFELTVSDGLSEPSTDTVTVTVSAAPTGIVTGRVVNAEDLPVSGARIEVVRLDGEAAPVAITGPDGRFRVIGVRAGTNLITAFASGYEPVSELIEVGSGETVDIELVLSELAAVLTGTVQLSSGSPLAGAVVELLGSDDEVLASDVTDRTGVYAIENITQEAAEKVVAVRVSHAGAITWLRTGVEIFPGEVNVLDFLYASLTVKVDARPRRLRKQLKGVEVEVLLEGDTVISATVSKRNRKVVFPNVPAQEVRVRASGGDLRADQQTLVLTPGSRGNSVTLVLRPATEF